MVLIYDFDGTLTPYSCPQLPILQKCGSIEEFYEILSKRDLMTDFCITLKEYMENHGYQYNLENICYAADTIELNPGVLDFLGYFKNERERQFVVSASYEGYLKSTKVAPLVDGIYGTTIEGDVVLPEKKIEIISNIIDLYKPLPEGVFYIGDGLTDSYAFKFVKAIGGNAILVYNEMLEKDRIVYEKLKNEGIINEAFPKDFSIKGPIFNYVRTRSLK